MSLLRAVFQTGFTHHGSHLVAVACMCRDAGMGTLCLRPDWVHSPRFFKKNAIFLLFVRVRNDKNTTHVAKFAPSLGPVPLPPTPPRNRPRALAPPSQPFPDPQTARGKPRRLHVTRSTLQLSKNNTPTLPEPKPLDSPPSPCPLLWNCQASQPFPGLAPLWNSQPSPNPPPSLELPSSPYAPPQGILQKTPFFFQKYDTRCEICSVPGAYPPRNRSPWTPPGTAREPLPRQANPSLTPKQHEANRDATRHEVNPSTVEK